MKSRMLCICQSRDVRKNLPDSSMNNSRSLDNKRKGKRNWRKGKLHNKLHILTILLYGWAWVFVFRIIKLAVSMISDKDKYKEWIKGKEFNNKNNCNRKLTKYSAKNKILLRKIIWSKGIRKVKIQFKNKFLGN